MSFVNGKTEERDLRNLCKITIILRVICVGTVLSVVAFLTAAGFDIKEVFPIAGLLAVVFPLSGIWWILYRSGRGLKGLAYSQVIGDLVLVAGLVYFTGGVHSHLNVLFLVSIFVAGILLCMKGALLAATLAAALFAAASLLQEVRFERTIGAPSDGRTMSYLLMNIALQSGFFYLIGILSGHAARRITIFGARLKSTTSELEKTRLDTHQIIDSMSSGLITVDSKKVITEFNKSASRILGIEPGRAKGRDFHSVLGPISPDLCKGLTDALHRKRVEERAEVCASTRDGEIPLGVSISLMCNHDGTATGAVSVFQDLTEVKNMSERIRLADRLAALGELSAAVAHEIRSPLASICGSVEMLRDSLKSGGEDARLVDLVVKESDRLRKIIDHFLAFARSRPARFKKASLNSIINEVVCLVKNLPSFDSGVTIEFNSESEVDASVDEETIKQVFYNLALNSIEAINGSGDLRITLGLAEGEAPGQLAEIVFRDTGVGIEPEDMNRVCQPFFTRKQSGTGLGLAIVSKIVEEHGGKLNIESKKGKGTVATVYLPLDRAEDSSTCYRARSSPGHLETANTRVE